MRKLYGKIVIWSPIRQIICGDDIMLESKRLALLRILQILEKYSDYNHPLTQEDIARYLSKDYGIEIERKAISRNISFLKEAGFEIEFTNKAGSYLACREFEDSELRLLIDGIRFSKNIKKSYSDEIVDKLLKMGTPSFRESMLPVKYLSANRNVQEPQLFFNIGELSAAISQNKKVEFHYLTYKMDKELTPVWGEKIIVTPQELVAANGEYYLIGLIDGNDQFTNFRLERIRDLVKLDLVGDEDIKFDLNEYLATHPRMWCGEPVKAKLKVSIVIMSDVVDFFGTDFDVSKTVENEAEITVNATEADIIEFALNNPFFAEVLAPAHIRQRIKSNVRDLVDKYGV